MTCNRIMLIIILIILLIIISKPNPGKPPTKLNSVGGSLEQEVFIFVFYSSKIYRIEIPKSLGLESPNLSGWASIDEKMRLPFCDGRRIVIQI